MTEEEFSGIINALKVKALGNTIEQVVQVYKRNEDGKKVLTEETVKKIKNDIDTQACIKLIDIELKRREIDKVDDKFNNMTDEELEKEKQRLLLELHEQVSHNYN